MPINEYGEIVSKESLLEEIQALLNRLEESPSTQFDPYILEALDLTTLNQIRDNLLKKVNNEIDTDWLFGLVDK